MAEKKSVRIIPTKKLLKLKNADVTLRDLINQLTTILYGKKLTECLGQAQSVRKKNIPSTQYDLCIPQFAWDKSEAYHLKTVHNDPWHPMKVTLRQYLKNIIKHAKKNGISVTIIVT